MAFQDIVLSSWIARAQALNMKFPMSALRTIAQHASYQPGDFHVNEADYITLAASATDSEIITPYQVPAGMLGMIDSYANGVPNLAFWDYITWKLVVNTRPVPGFDALQSQIGFIMAPAPVGWPLMSGDTIHLLASNSLAVALPHVTAVVRCRLFPAVTPEIEDIQRRELQGCSTADLRQAVVCR